MRKGYYAEYSIKMKLSKTFGKHNVIKVAIGQNAPDYIVLTPKMGIEVKSTKKGAYYPTSHDREQWEMFNNWSKLTDVPINYWIKINRKWVMMTHHAFEKVLDNGVLKV